MPKETPSAVTVEKIILLDALPSGSGLALADQAVFVVGDDSPYLFRLSREYELTNKYLLLQHQADSNRISKQQKPDFESMAPALWNGQESLLIFGSGSKSPERDSLLIVPLEQPEKPRQISLTSLYNIICQKEGIDRDEFNIEGAVLVQEQLWLFNRGRNSVILIDWPALSDYLKQTDSEPTFSEISDSTIRETSIPADASTLDSLLHLRVYPIRLPEIRGKEARLSGACEIPGTHKVLFTASVEDTENWIDDGEILGSFVGILDEEGLQQSISPDIWLLEGKEGETLREKLESVEVLSNKGNSMLALAITDNDDGTSKLLELKFSNISAITPKPKK